MEQKKDHATTSYAFPRTSVTFILTSWSCIPLEVPFGENFDLLVRVVSLGEAHTLAIAADNKILAWGRNTEKQVSPLCEQQKVVSPFEIDLFATVGVVDSSGAGTTTVLSAKEAKTSPDRRTSSSPKLLIKEVFAREDHNIVLAKQVLHGRSSASRKPPASKAAVKKDDPAAPRFLGSPDVDHDHVDGNEALTMATKNATRNARSYPGVVAPRRRGPSAFVGDEELSKDLPREQDAHDVEQEFVPQEGSAAVAPPVPMDVDDRTSSAGTGRVSSPPRQKRKISPRDEDGLEEDARRRRGGGSSRRTVTLVDSDGNLLSGASDNGDSDEDLDPFERTDRREGSSAASSSAVSSASDMIMLDQDPNPTDAVMRDRSASSAASDHPFPRGQSDLLPRQYSRGCGSTTSRHITLFTKTEKTRRDQSIQKILIPGAAGNIQFYALENSFFGEAVDRLTAEATNLSAELAQFSTALTGTFRCPSVLSSSFVFRGLQNQKLDVDNYLEGTARLWNVMVLARATVGTVSGTSAAATTTPPQTPKTPAPPSTGPELQALELCLAIEWVQAIYAGLTTLQPQCLLARDQLRCLLVYLLAPVWRSVGELLPLSRSSGEDSGLEREPSFDRLGSLKDLTKMGSREKGGGTVLGGKGGGAASSLQSGTNSTKTSDTATLRLIESTDRKRNSELVRCFKLLAKTIMFLSKTAKRKFCEMIQEELSVVAVTERLLPNLQCMARAVFHTRGAFEERRVLLPTNEQAFVLNIQDSVWHCVGLFDMVYAACYTPWLAKHKIPKSAFHLECLLDKKKPQQQGFFHAQESTETLVSPDADYHLFSQYCAKKAILVNNLEAVSLDPLRDNEFCCLPSEMMSFIAHPHLCPTVYKQKVLEFENDFDHRQVQQAILTRLIQSGRLHPGQQIPAQQLAELMCAVLDVRRSNIVEDTFRGIGKFNDLDLVKKLKVTFVGEEGVDDGGLTKELYNLLSVELFNPQYGMFVEVEVGSGDVFRFFSIVGGELHLYHILSSATHNILFVTTTFLPGQFDGFTLTQHDRHSNISPHIVLKIQLIARPYAQARQEQFPPY